MAVLLSNGQNNLKDTLHHILGSFGADLDCARGVFIKPNVVFPVRAESGEITPPALVRTLILALRERFGDVDILLGEGVAAGCDPWENLTISGYAKLADELNVPLLDLHSAERETVAWKFGTLKLPKVALERTYINVPILKPSSACVISGALKNQKGLLLPAAKKQFHRLGLNEPVAELNALVQPCLTIMDGSRYFGRNALLSGTNCGEVDATACDLLDIEEPEHVRLSKDAQVFSGGYSVIGDHLRITRASLRPVAREFKRLGRLRLWSNPQACTMGRYLFRDLKQQALKGQCSLAGAKLLVHSVTGAEVIMGSNPQWRREYQTVICIGDCTRRVAKEGGYIFIPGCPPTLSDLSAIPW